jgi:hypothetical protein
MHEERHICKYLLDVQIAMWSRNMDIATLTFMGRL